VVYFTAPRTLLQILIALLVLCPIGRIVAQVLGDGFGYYVLMPLRADILAVGALIALLKFSSGAVSQPTRRAVQIAFWLIASFFPVFAWAVEKSDFNMAVWGHTYLVAFYGLAVFMVLDNKGARPLALLRSRAAAFLARISYALYLVHGPVLILTFLAAHLSPTVHTASGVLLTACAFAISIAICSASYLLVERPFIRIAHERFRYVGSKAKAYGFSAR
jgi:peptidoglycan/LPS O-acetylase OafA/YrhL